MQSFELQILANFVECLLLILQVIVLSTLSLIRLFLELGGHFISFIVVGLLLCHKIGNYKLLLFL
jgi:hypothetical protein